VKLLVDYRPALRARTGVGEYVHEVVRAYAATHHDDDVAVFTSSWKDRPRPDTASRLGARVIDRRVPVQVLNYLWHRTQWPPIELLAGPVDVVHAAHPLIIPARAAARVVTVHDLFFLSNPDGMRAEIRRDYAALAGEHARRAEAVITPSHYTRTLVIEQLGVPADRVYACPFGPPTWRALGHAPNVPRDGYLLFVGTLIARKNLGTLLDAYTKLRRRLPDAPRLVLAGGATADAKSWLVRIAEPPLAGHVEHIGYFEQEQREALYAGARALLMPSLDEGFGVPALEAMSAGVPVIVSNRGSLPEVVGKGGTVLDAMDADGLAVAMERVVMDDAWAGAQGCAGLERARDFSWAATARRLEQAYTEAIARRRTHA
jgi:glycosyltransferase involved in cell wall biosynthesis